MEFGFIIKDDRLFLNKQKEAYSGNVNSYICKFDILANKELKWICVFKKGDKVYQQVVENNQCLIPQEVLLGDGKLEIGCYATSDSGDFKRISTNWISVIVSSGAYCEGTAPKIPEKDVWETLILKNVPIIGENGNWYIYDTDKKDYVDSGRMSKGEKGDKGDRGETGLPGTTNTANAIKGRIIGQAVAMDDISPVEHILDVSVRSKNMVKRVIYSDAAANAGAVNVADIIPLKVGKTYTISWDTLNTGVYIWVVWLSGYRQGINSSTTQKCDGKRHSYTFKLLELPPRWDGMAVQVSSSAETTSGLCSNFMIEEGEALTDYTPYVTDISNVLVEVTDDDGRFEEVYPSQDGTLQNVVSSYPSMNIATDNSNVVVDATYNKDINKAFQSMEEKFTNAIISLGGNV